MNTREMEGLENAVVLACVVFLFALEVFFYSQQIPHTLVLLSNPTPIPVSSSSSFPPSAAFRCPVLPFTELEQPRGVSRLVPLPCSLSHPLPSCSCFAFTFFMSFLTENELCALLLSYLKT